jgi:uncharacterized metal-binding protein YceD (DUF177 family)
MSPADAPLLSRPIVVDDVPEKGLAVEVVADADERAVLAKAFGLSEIKSLTGRFDVRRKGREAIAKGEVTATVVQICVVTLDPFEAEVKEEVDLRFVPDAPALDDEDAPPDSPDPIVDGRIDLGAITAEFLALGLDPYPKKPGAAFAFQPDADKENPFSVLAALKRDRD